MKDPIRSSSILLVVECGFQPFRVTRESVFQALLIANLNGSVKAVAQGSFRLV